MLFSFSVLPPTSPEVEEATPLAAVKGKEKEKIREKKIRHFDMVPSHI